jgi:cytochrome P450
MSIVEFDFSPFGEASIDPYPAYAAMREAGRVLKNPWGALMVHRYDDVRAAHGDHDSLSLGAIAGVGGTGMGGGGGTGMGGGGMAGGNFLLAQSMLTSDPPDHSRLRRVVNRAFTPRSIAALEPRVRQIARQLLAPLAGGEPFDMVADFAAPLPTAVIAELLGVPPEDCDQFRLWTEVVTGTDVRRRVNPEESRRFGSELRHYLSLQIDKRKDAPTDDLIGRMVEANAEQVMTDAEVVASCVLLLIAGNETTMRLVTNMTLALGRHPEQLARLVADPGLIPTGVEETLRYDTPVQMLFRAAKHDTSVAGVDIARGQFVLTLLAAANRDPDAFADPDLYDVGRKDNMHVAFGHGIHYCLGAPLARLEARVAFEELLDMAPAFSVLTRDEDLEYGTGMLRSPRSLAVQA